MARLARRDVAMTGEVVDARLEPANEKHMYYCVKNKCKARMYAYALGNTNARFVSYDKNDHVSISCMCNEFDYNPNSHDEKLFDIVECAGHICGKGNESKTMSHHKRDGLHVKMENNVLTPIRTVNELYLQFCVTGLGNKYNGYLIDDYFACRDNYVVKSKGFEGFQLVETSFFKYRSYTKYMDFNFPPFNAVTRDAVVHIRLDFGDEKRAYRYYMQHFMDKTTKKPKKNIHNKLIVVAGIWEKVDNDDVVAMCKINNINQLKFYD